MTTCGSRLLYEPQHGKEVLYVVPASSVLGAGDTGFQIQCRSWKRCSYDSDLAWADTRPGAGDGCSMFYVNAWALGWSRDM